MRRRGKREGGMARDPGMDGDLRAAWHQAATAPGNVSRITARRGWPVPGAGGAGAPAVDGADAQGLPAGVAGMAVPGARIVGASRAQPRSAVRRAELARYVRTKRSPAAVLRPARIGGART